MSIFYLAIAFCLIEVFLSGLILGLSGSINFWIKGQGTLDTFKDSIGFGLLSSVVRISVLQIVLELVAIFIIIKLGGWPKLWMIISAVFLSMTVWATIFSVLKLQGITTGIGRPFYVAFVMGGPSILIGSISAWLILYKWHGLKSLTP